MSGKGPNPLSAAEGKIILAIAAGLTLWFAAKVVEDGGSVEPVGIIVVFLTTWVGVFFVWSLGALAYRKVGDLRRGQAR